MTLPWYVPALWVGICLLIRRDATMAALLGYHALCLLAVAPQWRNLRWGLWPRFGWILVAGLALTVPFLLRTPELPHFPLDHLRAVVARWPGGLASHAVYVLLVNVPVEEAFWRGLQEDLHPNWPAWIHGAAFGLHHLVGAALVLGPLRALPIFLVTATAGALWAKAARRCGGLGLVIATHALADLGLLAIAASQLR